MVSATERLSLDLEVHLQVHEQIDILSGFEGDEAAEGAHGGPVDYSFTLCFCELGFLNAGTDFTNEELVYLLHLEFGSVQESVLPLLLGHRGVVLGLLLAADGKSGDEEVFELIETSDRVVV
jgi:hypothetical protein